jgi:uncharacterized protein YndB with AHSA1/START domain
MVRFAVLSILAALTLPGAAWAEVIDSQPNGFTVRESRVVAAPPERVWQVLITPSAWWDAAHTYSKDARNISLAPKPGGFWQEALPTGGGVRHMVVIYVDPPKMLRLEGALGPLQAAGAAGHLTFLLTPHDAATSITATYDVGGHTPGGLDKLSGPVDHVLDEQLGHLKASAEAADAPR